jgi:hypothetical protein
MALTMTVPKTHSLESTSTPSAVWRVGAIATILGAVVTEAFSLVARAIDVPMFAADPGADAAKEIPVGGFGMAVVMWAGLGAVLAVVLARRAKRPARTFAVTTVALTALSLLGPILATHTTTATKTVLFVAHLIAAAVVIPPITRRLALADR